MGKRSNLLIADTIKNPTDGIGNTEALKHNLSGWYSKRITTPCPPSISHHYSLHSNILWILFEGECEKYCFLVAKCNSEIEEKLMLCKIPLKMQ